MGNGTQSMDITPNELIDPAMRLRIAEALHDQESFTRGQVAILLHLAFHAGLSASLVDEISEVRINWLDHATARLSADQRRAQRVQDMERAAKDAAQRRSALGVGTNDPFWPPTASVGGAR